MKDPQAYDQMAALSPDLAVLAFVTDIVPGKVLAVPKLGAYPLPPLHPPQIPGASAINWAVINGERESGLTIFWVDEGIDTGDILLQKKVEIGPNETTGELYFNKLSQLGVEAAWKPWLPRGPGPGPPYSPRPLPGHLRPPVRREGGRPQLEPAGPQSL